VWGKKRYSPFRDTDLAFLLERRLQVDTLILAGINTTSCVLSCGFEATNRDYRIVVAADAVDSMDGEEMHRFALRLMAATAGWVLANDDIIAALGECQALRSSKCFGPCMRRSIHELNRT
jgi:nicotinamidase-related amidase